VVAKASTRDDGGQLMPSRFTQYSSVLGAESALKQMVAERIAAQMEQQKQAVEAYKLQQEDRKIGQGDRRIDVDVDQFGKTHALDTTKHGENVRQFNEQAPNREASAGYLRTQSRHLEETPLRDTAGRVHDENMAKLGHGFRLGQINRQGEIDAGLIDRRQAGDPKGDPSAPSPYAAERNTRNRQSITDLDSKVSRWTTGAGSLLANIPETDARDFAASLNTLKANIAFGELAAMREASKTGGALGAISERELALLESSLGALDPGQSPAAFKGQLKQIADSIDRWELARGGMAQPGRTGAGTVSMVAPDGRALMVPADKVAEMEAKGARRK
jgi:hypothetical protein